MTIRILISLMLLVAFLAGCSDREKEAARLEEELRGGQDEAGAVAEDSSAMTDSLAGVAEEVYEPEEEIPETYTPSMPPIPEGSGYVVQVASCESAEYARHLVDIYAGRGYEAFVIEITYDGQTYHRVRVGPFETVGEAKALKDELVDKYSIEPWIDRHNE